jgi:Flp pilus assembly protein TadB
VSGPPTEGNPERGPLRSEPRPLALHWLVDSAVVFLATIIVALIIGLPWWSVLIVALILGAFGARLTYRWDVDAMAERRAG